MKDKDKIASHFWYTENASPAADAEWPVRLGRHGRVHAERPRLRRRGCLT